MVRTFHLFFGTRNHGHFLILRNSLLSFVSDSRHILLLPMPSSLRKVPYSAFSNGARRSLSSILSFVLDTGAAFPGLRGYRSYRRVRRRTRLTAGLAGSRWNRMLSLIRSLMRFRHLLTCRRRHLQRRRFRCRLPRHRHNTRLVCGH